MSTPARIGYLNYTSLASLPSGGVVVSDFEPENILNPLTYELFKPNSLSASDATLIIQLDQQRAIDYIAIGGHTLGTNGCTATISMSNGGVTYTNSKAYIATNNNAIFYTFSESSVTHVKIIISGGTVPTISTVYAGNYLEMDEEFTEGMSVPTLARKTEYKTTKSESGQYLGRSVSRMGQTAKFDWNYIDLSWYIDNVDAFVEHAQTKPFFIQWSPDKYDTQNLYCWCNQDISPSLTNQNEFVKFGFKVEAIA